MRPLLLWLNKKNLPGSTSFVLDSGEGLSLRDFYRRDDEWSSYCDENEI
jgi:hypothetical protein